MHEQFTRMQNERVSKYSSIIYHMFLYYQSDRFPLTIQKLDTKCQPMSVIFWTPLFHKYSSPYTYTNFIDLFVHPIMTMLTGSSPPRISQDIKRFLQLSKQIKVGDWYFYQNCTEIRAYGFELPPYKLPNFFPTRIFSLG